MRKSDFTFPVRREKLYYLDNSIWIPTNQDIIIREDTDEIISYVPRTYHLKTNAEIFDKIFEALQYLNLSVIIDPVNSFLSNERMICHLLLTDIIIKDDESAIFLSILIKNSYDRSRAFDFKFGMFRGICSNGSLLGYKSLMEGIYRKHTKGFSLHPITSKIKEVILNFPEVQKRIEHLQTVKFETSYKKQSVQTLGNKFEAYMSEDLGIKWIKIKTLYDLYNEMTYFVTHKIPVIEREQYLDKIAKGFFL